MTVSAADHLGAGVCPACLFGILDHDRRRGTNCRMPAAHRLTVAPDRGASTRLLRRIRPRVPSHRSETT